MLYIIQILSAILIGISAGTLMGQRNTVLLGASVIAIVLAIITIITGTWQFLLAGVAVYLLAQSLQRDPVSA